MTSSGKVFSLCRNVIYCGMAALTVAMLAQCSSHDCRSAVTSALLSRECLETMPAGFVYVDEAAPLVRTELKYGTHDNFIGRPMAGYKGKRAILRTEAARQLKLVSEDLDRQGYSLLIYDAYRPHLAMIDINCWALDLNDQKMKADYYPHIDKERIFKDLYIRDFSEHSRGVAVDITLVPKTHPRRPVDMGSGFDLLDPVSATDSDKVTPEQRRNRQLLKHAMEARGFVNYAPEWWHYRLKDEPDINTYFLFPVCDGMKKTSVSIRIGRSLIKEY